METRIEKTLKQWFPIVFNNKEKFNSDYEILRFFANYTQYLIDTNDEKRKEPFKIINLLYSRGKKNEKNAIENEFFYVLAKSQKSTNLMEQLELMPETIRNVYLKTILEN